MDHRFIEDRRVFLEMFCRVLARTKYLWYSEEANVFLRSTNPDIEKVYFMNKSVKL